MSFVARKAVRVLLLNDKDELLLMCLEGFDIATIDGKKNQRFWCTLGGAIEEGETVEQAALREVYEEAGIQAEAINPGPIVWISSVELLHKGNPTRLEESFIVARTNEHNVFLHQPTLDEKETVKKLQWFSFEDIQKCEEVIFPLHLSKYLPDILAGNYPKHPIVIKE